MPYFQKPKDSAVLHPGSARADWRNQGAKFVLTGFNADESDKPDLPEPSPRLIVIYSEHAREYS